MALTLEAGDNLPEGKFRVRKCKKYPAKYSSWGIIDVAGDFIKYQDPNGITYTLDFGTKEYAQEFIRENSI